MTERTDFVTGLGIDVNGDQTNTSSLSYPKEVWEYKPQFRHILQAARATMMIPDFALTGVLARVALMTPYWVRLPNTIAAPNSGTLDWYTAWVARPGGGKTTALDLAKDLLPLDEFEMNEENPRLRDDVHLGTGEGIIDAFLTDPKRGKAPEQLYDGVLIEADEGQMLAELTNRKGSILMPILHKGFMGSTLATQNAELERRRHIPARRYRLAIIMGFQPSNAATVLENVDQGTPQRFHWLWGQDLGSTRRRPEYPGPIEFIRPARSHGRPSVTPRDMFALQSADPAEREAPELLVMTCDSRIVDDIERARVQSNLGAGDMMNQHDHLAHLKLASLIALFTGGMSYHVGWDDWLISGLMMDVSRNVREYVKWLAEQELRKRMDVQDQRAVHRAVLSVEAQRQQTFANQAFNLAKAIDRSESGELTDGEARQKLHSSQRENYDEIVNRGVELGYFDLGNGKLVRSKVAK